MIETVGVVGSGRFDGRSVVGFEFFVAESHCIGGDLAGCPRERTGAEASESVESW